MRRSFLRRAPALWGAAAVVTCALSASGATSLAPDNGGGIDTRLFRTAVDSKGFFTVDGADVQGKGDVAFGLVLDAGFGLLRLREKPARVIDTQLHGVLMGSISPVRGLTIGLGLPTDLVSGDPLGTPPPEGTVAGRKTDVNAFFNGAWLLYAKLRLLSPDDAPVGIAIIGRAEHALSDDARRGYAASPGTTLTPSVAFESRLGPGKRLRVGANVGASLITGDGSRIGDLSSGSAKHGHLARAGIAVSWRLTDDLDLVAESYGSQLLKGGGAGTSIEGVGGVKVFVEKNSYLLIGGGVGITDGYQAASQRAFLGFVFEPSVGDRDGDGVKDDVDLCPDVPEDRDGFHDEDGCPDPDNDGDGFLDKDDRCPNDAETFNGYIDDDGCPDTVPGDSSKLDDKKTIIFDGPVGVLIKPIQFDYDSAKIAKESLPIVDDVAKILNDHPEYELIEVTGHADERGNDKYNLELTQKRAESVVAALIARGVKSSRLRAPSFGEYCPIDESHTEEAWSKNRRVVFVILRDSNGKTDVPLGCANATAHGVTSKPVP